MKRKKLVEKIIIETTFHYKFTFSGVIVEGSAKRKDLNSKILQELNEYFSDEYIMPNSITSSPVVFPDQEFVWSIGLISKENSEDYYILREMNNPEYMNFVDMVEISGKIEVNKIVSTQWK